MPSRRATSSIIPGVGESLDASMVGLLASIESLNVIANSNAVKVLSNTAEMADKMKKVVKVIKDMNDIFQKSKIVMEMAAMTVNIYNEYIAYVKEIYNNKELLGIEEIEMFVALLDYAIFDAVAADMDKGKKISAAGVAGGVFEELENIFDWIQTSDDEKVKYTDLEAKVAKTYNRLSSTSRDLRIMRKYTYGYMVAKRYRRGAFDNGEYIRYVYYSKYRQQALK
jgi:hypothetical protein